MFKYYQILGLSSPCTEAQLKSAYRHLASKWHPDKNKSSEATVKFQEIHEAYRQVSIYIQNNTQPKDPVQQAHARSGAFNPFDNIPPGWEDVVKNSAKQSGFYGDKAYSETGYQNKKSSSNPYDNTTENYWQNAYNNALDRIEELKARNNLLDKVNTQTHKEVGELKIANEKLKEDNKELKKTYNAAMVVCSIISAIAITVIIHILTK